LLLLLLLLLLNLLLPLLLLILPFVLHIGVDLLVALRLLLLLHGRSLLRGWVHKLRLAALRRLPCEVRHMVMLWLLLPLLYTLLLLGLGLGLWFLVPLLLLGL